MHVLKDEIMQKYIVIFASNLFWFSLNFHEHFRIWNVPAVHMFQPL
jgi:hypothetical protein